MRQVNVLSAANITIIIRAVIVIAITALAIWDRHSLIARFAEKLDVYPIIPLFTLMAITAFCIITFDLLFQRIIIELFRSPTHRAVSNASPTSSTATNRRGRLSR